MLKIISGLESLEGEDLFGSLGSLALFVALRFNKWFFARKIKNFQEALHILKKNLEAKGLTKCKRKFFEILVYWFDDFCLLSIEYTIRIVLVCRILYTRKVVIFCLWSMSTFSYFQTICNDNLVTLELCITI